MKKFSCEYQVYDVALAAVFFSTAYTWHILVYITAVLQSALVHVI